MRGPRIRPRRSQEGQGLVEMALVLPIFLLMVFGVFDVGYYVYADSVLSQAAREGARVAAAEASWIGMDQDMDPSCYANAADIPPGSPGAHVCPVDSSALKAHIEEAARGMAVAVGGIEVFISCNAGDTGDPAPGEDWTDALGDVGNGCATGASTGDVVSVRVTHTHQPITPIVGSLVGTIPLSGSATMIVN